MGELIGYARCSTVLQDLAAQRQTLASLGVSDDRVYLDHRMSGRNRKRPGLEQALAAARGGDTLVVPKLDRLARSVPDARAIGGALTAGGVRLSVAGTVYDPTDPMGKMFFNILATFAEFEVDLSRMREGMAIARANGKLKGKQPKVSPRQQAELVRMRTGRRILHHRPDGDVLSRQGNGLPCSRTRQPRRRARAPVIAAFVGLFGVLVGVFVSQVFTIAHKSRARRLDALAALVAASGRMIGAYERLFELFEGGTSPPPRRKPRSRGDLRTPLCPH